ncbi:MAG: zinc-dependent alcohol dehydrogenase family protein [Bacteroidota bacterium]
MKSVQFNEIGGPEILKVVETDIPRPAGHEVLVKIKACGLNQAELLFFQGQYLFQPEFPSKLGLEASGIIEDVGTEVKGFQPGDEVCLTPNIMPYEYGYLGEYAVAPAEAVVAKPRGITFDEAAAFWMTYATSYAGLIMKGGLKKDSTVLITAGSSAVGIAAIQVAKHLRANIITTTRSGEKREFLLSQGADEVIVTSEQDLVEEIGRITNSQGFNLAFDPIAGEMLNPMAEAAAPEANIVLYGALSYNLESALPLFPVLAKGLQFSGVHLVFHLLQHPDRFEKAKTHLLEGLESAAYRPVIDRKFDLKDITEAYRFMESNQQKGKIVIIP